MSTTINLDTLSDQELLALANQVQDALEVRKMYAAHLDSKHSETPAVGHYDGCKKIDTEFDDMLSGMGVLDTLPTALDTFAELAKLLPLPEKDISDLVQILQRHPAADRPLTEREERALKRLSEHYRENSPDTKGLHERVGRFVDQHQARDRVFGEDMSPIQRSRMPATEGSVMMDRMKKSPATRSLKDVVTLLGASSPRRLTGVELNPIPIGRPMTQEDVLTGLSGLSLILSPQLRELLELDSPRALVIKTVTTDNNEFMVHVQGVGVTDHRGFTLYLNEDNTQGRADPVVSLGMLAIDMSIPRKEIKQRPSAREYMERARQEMLKQRERFLPHSNKEEFERTVEDVLKTGTSEQKHWIDLLLNLKAGGKFIFIAPHVQRERQDVVDVRFYDLDKGWDKAVIQVYNKPDQCFYMALDPDLLDEHMVPVMPCHWIKPDNQE